MSVRCSNTFFESLKTGTLSYLVERVKDDLTLDIELRDNEIEVYYRGAQLMRVNEKVFSKSENELVKGISFPPTEVTGENVQKWIDVIPMIKDCLDRNVSNGKNSGPKGAELEAEQIILRENNLLRGRSERTDYTIVDIEHVIDDYRFDLVAIKSLADRVDRRTPPRTLAVIELKYGYDAIFDSEASLESHFSDMANFIIDGRLEELKKDVTVQYNFKHRLGLFDIGSMKQRPDEDKEINKKSKWSRPEYIVVLANYANQYYLNKSNNSISDLINEIRKKYKTVFESFDVKFAIACGMGYSLFANCMLSTDDFLQYIESLKSMNHR